MENNKFGLGTFVCVFNRNLSKILLLKRNRKEKHWGNVGGIVNIGEKILEACIREAKEETGIDLDPKQLKLVDIQETPNFSKVIHALHFVYATTIDEGEEIHLSEESEEYGWFDLNNLPKNTLDTKEYLVSIANKIRINEVLL